MQFTHDWYPDIETIVNLLPSAFSFKQHINDFEASLYQAIADYDSIISIIDVRLAITNFETILQGAKAAGDRANRFPALHAKIRRDILITNNRVVAIAAKRLNIATFGYYQTDIFETVESAIAAIRKGN